MSDNNEKELEYISPFKYQLLQSFPFIAEDFDQFTAYGLFCKLSEKMNEVVANNNNLNDDMLLYIQKFNTLKAYIDNYFDNLDVQDEIDNKLDEMVTQGTLQGLINNYFVIVDDQIDALQTNLQNEINSVNITLDNKIDETNEELTNDINTLSNRMDTFTHLSAGSTTGDAELIDIRIGANGITYDTARKCSKRSI